MVRGKPIIALCSGWVCLVVGVVLSVASVASGEDRVIITEFMAANTRGLTDRDRERSDWIELHNPGAGPVNLEGWFLTDDRTDLKKWRFPAVGLGPGEFLLVFASKKDRRQPSAELHTNFKLDAERGYLALVRPDGATITTEFGPSYPRQVANASYGLEMGDRGVLLVGPNTPQHWLVPTRDLGAAWLTPEFDDARWGVATNRIGSDFLGETGNAGELRSQMQTRTASALVRIPFQVPAGGGAFDSLKLRLQYSDGFVAYVNGREVARRNAPEKVQWNSGAVSNRNVQSGLTLEESFESASSNYVTSQLDPATRPRPMRGSAAGAESYLRLINGRLTNQVAGIAFPEMTKGPFEAFQAEFDFRWRGNGEGTERLLFMLIPTSAYGANGQGVDLTAIREMKDPKFAGVLVVQLLSSPHDGKGAVTVHWDRTRQTTVNLPVGSFAQRLFHQAQVRLRFTESGALLDVVLVETRNGQRVNQQVVSQLPMAGLRPFGA